MRFALALLGMSVAVVATAESVPVVDTIEWKPLWEASGPISIPVTDEVSRQTFEIPALEPEGEGVPCLRFRARLHFAQSAGWNNYLAVEWNGVPLGGNMEHGAPRVLNRKRVFETLNPRYPSEPLVAQRGGMQCFVVFFGPPTPDLGEIVTDKEEGYWYLLDLSDVEDSMEKVSRLTFANTALREYFQSGLPDDCALVIEDLSIAVVDARTMRGLRERQMTVRKPLEGMALSGLGKSVVVTKFGGMNVSIDGERYYVESSFSFPREGGAGDNRLGCLDRAEGEPEWRPEFEAAPGSITLRARGRFYSLERKIERVVHRTVMMLDDEGKEVPAPPEEQYHILSGRVRVSDTITNLTGAPLGIAAKRTIIAPDYPRVTRLAGLDRACVAAGNSAENPTVFVAQARTGLGVVAEDNATRLQQASRVVENTVEFGTERLGLAPGESYTLTWVLYPSTADYYDFINQLRWDWDVNYTVDGPFDFFDVRQLDTPEGQEKARVLLARRKQKIFSLVPWFEYYNGWGLSRDEYKAMIIRGMEFIKGIVPDAKCIASIETNLVPADLSFFGGTIPAEGWPIGREAGGKYGQKATAAMTAKVDESSWRDSCLRDRDGCVKLDCWYVQHYRARPALNLMVYPAVGNHRHAQAMEQIAWLLDDVGLDGIYIDQFSLAWNADDNRHTLEKWDGRTVLLDENGFVKETMADLGLLSAEARRQWVEAILSRGKTVVCNTLPAVFEMQGLPTYRFTETQGYDPLAGSDAPLMEHLADGQLSSPIGLAHSFPSDAGADFFVRTVVAHLRFGQLYYYYGTQFPGEDEPNGRVGGEFGPVNLMFPFTPIELHEGWVVGKECLITCVSGELPWPFPDRHPCVTQFDDKGRLRERDAHVKWDGREYKVQVNLRDWREVAVIK